jgi:hypothetical protein
MNGGVLVAAAVLTSSGSCLYTDPINMPPTVRINPPLAQVWRGDPVTFTAMVNDPDSDPVTLDWTAVGGSCPSDQNADDDPRMWPPDQRVPGQMFEIPPSATQTPFCVWAFATDRHGAVRAATLQVDPSDHAPVAGIEIVESVSTVAGFSLYARLKFSGESSADADQSDRLDYQWMLSRKPSGSVAELAPCPEETTDTDKFACLSPDLPGDYEIQLTVADGMNLGATPISGTAKRMVSVAGDQLPCVSLTSPMFSSSTPAPEFAWNSRDPTLTVIKVDDDGDPFPLQSGIHFSWFMARGTGPLEYVPNDQNIYILPDNRFTIGEVVTVRAEVRDRKPDAVNAALAGCADDRDVCYNSRPGCTQRVTWRIRY